MRAEKPVLTLAKKLRSAMTPPEVRLWVRLRQMRLHGIRFRRQHAIGPYVLDFYCAEAKLAVEVDGIGHRMGDRPERDLRRDMWLNARGITVMHIPAVDVLRDADQIGQSIYQWFAANAPSVACGDSSPVNGGAEGPAHRIARRDSSAK